VKKIQGLQYEALRSRDYDSKTGFFYLAEAKNVVQDYEKVFHLSEGKI